VGRGHKPLLLLWLFGRFAATGSSAASDVQAKEPVSPLINDFAPPVASAAAARQRAAMPFVKLERELWQVRDRAGRRDRPGRSSEPQVAGGARRAGQPAPGGGAPARQPGDAGRGRPGCCSTSTSPRALAALICDALDLDVAELETAAAARQPPAKGRRPAGPGGQASQRRCCGLMPYQCAVCGFDGALGRNPVGIEAAHVR
jgi:putative restriction endonuclease